MMQVVLLKIYVYYNDKLFGIFHSGFIRAKSLVWMALSNMEHCTLLILLHVLCFHLHNSLFKYNAFVVCTPLSL